MALQIPVLGNMVGSGGRLAQNNGDIAFRRPPQLRIELGYINIQNTTENTINIYALSDDTDSSTPSYRIGSYMAISLKLNQKLAEGVIITYVNPNPATTNDVKPLEIIWSEGSLGWNNSLAPSYQSQYTGTSVNVINIPHTIVDSGNIAISNIPHTVVDSGNIAISNVPHTVVDSGNIAISNIPHVIVDSGSLTQDYSIPLTGSQNNTALVLTAPAVASNRNYCSFYSLNSQAGVIGASNVSVQIKDGATVIYEDVIPATSVAGFRISMNFTPPLQCSVNSALTLNIGASGTAGTIIRGNMGYFNK